MSRNSLTALIREVSAEHANAHPHKIARLVAERTEPDDVQDFYVTALLTLVADIIRADRNHTMNSKAGRSPKVEQRRNWWARMLSERVSVGDSMWKPLGQCTVDDLDFCITERHSQIAALHTQIGKYEVIRDAMITHGCETAADLPEGAVEL